MSRTLYSIGHSTHPLQRFVELCRPAGVEVIADVRRFPRSRRNPQFGRERLERELPARGIGYAWLGADLGGFREGGYEDWMNSAAFRRGVAELERLAAKQLVGFMCAEASPDRCHRRFVAEALASRGHRVAHLLPDGELVWVHSKLELPDP